MVESSASPTGIANYCSYVDLRYLPRLVALVESIRKFDSTSSIFVLCLDGDTLEHCDRILGESVTTLSLEDLEEAFPELRVAKANRTSMEYVFTLTPFLIRWVMEHSNNGNPAIYLDADLYFFESPDGVLEELGSSEVGIIPHNYPAEMAQSLRKYGLYNVGWVGFRNSESARLCLGWWASQCLEWCGDEPLDGKYADQGYLDQFPNLFEGVKVLENRGFNLAPWNTSGQVIDVDPQGRLRLGDGTQLTFFHFHGLKRFGKWMVTSQLNYKSPSTKPLIEHVYKPYLRALQKAEKALKATTSGRSTKQLVRGKGLRKWARTLSGKLLMVASVLTRNAVDMSKLK